MRTDRSTSLRHSGRALIVAGVAATLFVTPRLSIADDEYSLNPAIVANMRSLVLPFSPAGGSIDMPASAGVSASLRYPPNDACKGARIFLDGLGPVGAGPTDEIFPPDKYGWQTFYVLTITITQTCDRQWVAFTDYPKLKLTLTNSIAQTHYFGDVVVESGSSSHVPLGATDVTSSGPLFDFSDLPHWLISDGLRLPCLTTIRFFAARQ